MAVFQGARLRTLGLPARRGAPPRARVVSEPASASAPRIRPTGLLMAAILTATMLGLVYLTQTLASNATSLEIQTLGTQAATLRSQLLNQSSKIELEANSDAIIREARQLGLRRLGDPVVLSAP